MNIISMIVAHPWHVVEQRTGRLGPNAASMMSVVRLSPLGQVPASTERERGIGVAEPFADRLAAVEKDAGGLEILTDSHGISEGGPG